MKWQIICSDQKNIYIHSWDNKEYIVYNSLTGDTHLLNQSAGRLLLELKQSPADTDTLANLTAPTDKNKSEKHHIPETEDLLEELNSLNLIENI